MTAPGGTFRSTADIDEEIARLTAIREENERLLADPEQRKQREIRREQLAGRCVMEQIRRGDQSANSWLSLVSHSAGEESWLFDPFALEADGYTNEPGEDGKSIWRRQPAGTS